jgi:hypothetical protein
MSVSLSAIHRGLLQARAAVGPALPAIAPTSSAGQRDVSELLIPRDGAVITDVQTQRLNRSDRGLIADPSDHGGRRTAAAGGFDGVDVAEAGDAVAASWPNWPPGRLS